MNTKKRRYFSPFSDVKLGGYSYNSTRICWDNQYFLVNKTQGGVEHGFIYDNNNTRIRFIFNIARDPITYYS